MFLEAHHFPNLNNVSHFFISNLNALDIQHIKGHEMNISIIIVSIAENKTNGPSKNSGPAPQEPGQSLAIYCQGQVK